ncbi:MAG TPA: 2'-5' RNA ligase family protein [Oculatellaceae cyanobacterium]
MQMFHGLKWAAVVLLATTIDLPMQLPCSASDGNSQETANTASNEMASENSSTTTTTTTTTGVGKYNVPVSDTTTRETSSDPSVPEQIIKKHTVYTRLSPADASQTIIETKTSDSIKYGRQNFGERLKDFRAQMDKAIANSWISAQQAADLNSAFDKLVTEGESIKSHGYSKTESDEFDSHLNAFNIQLSDAMSKTSSKSKPQNEESAVAAVTAIDIALNPGATMAKHAEEANAELRKNYAKGFALDASHHPHITLVQRFVKTADLEKVYDATNKILVKEKPATLKLKALKFNYFKDKGKDTGLECIVVEPTPALLKLQQELLDAIAPYTAASGTAAAFETTKDDQEINESTIHFVTHFLQTSTGKKYSPHVSTGVGTVDFLDKVVAKPFHEFSFSPAGVSIYHLGNYGTARKELKSF